MSNQSGKIYATAKTHKFDSMEYITIPNLKFRPIISQIRTYTYNAAKVLSKYLKLLRQSEYKINDTQSFVWQIKEKPPLDKDKEYVSYDLDSSSTNIFCARNHLLYYLSKLHRKETSPNLQWNNFQKIIAQSDWLTLCNQQFLWGQIYIWNFWSSIVVTLLGYVSLIYFSLF